MNSSGYYISIKSSIFIYFLLLCLAACGGSSGGNQEAQGWIPGVFKPDSDFAGRCEKPRKGVIDPNSGQASFKDIQGTALDENNWLRSWSDNVYLWYNEILDQDPAGFNSPKAYFPVLKTFATTSSGKAKDPFHFTFATDAYQQQSQSGVSAGYGVTFNLTSTTPSGELVVAYTEPGSPATSASANLQRGTKILEVDGVEFLNSSNNPDRDIINAGLFPETIGETHRFKVQDIASASIRTISMTSAIITSQPVQNVTTIETTTGKVGYLVFNDHFATAEQQLIDALSRFKAEGVNDLVLDLRYNGGGLLYIAGELGSMIAGPDTVNGEVFGTLQYNDKHPDINPFSGDPIAGFPFLSQTPAFSPTPGRELPSLELSRIFILTGPGTCSASESIINGLRGIDLEVIQIGSTTCGKPYGFVPTDNCGTTYFSINFSSVNAKGFGDYADGFSPVNTLETAGVRLPGCSVADDFTHPLGDVLEARLATALFYRENNSCPQARARAVVQAPLASVDGEILKPLWLKNAMMRSQ